MQLKNLLLALPAFAAAAPTPDASPQELSVQIVGGSTASAGQFPYIVTILRSGSLHCGGSLVNGNTVITAAHCATLEASTYTVRAGSLNWASGGVTVSVSQVIRNPAYSGNNNDIAIFKLAATIPTSSTISYVSLPAAGSDPAADTSSTVAGWGTTSENGPTSSTLRYVDVPIVSRATCQAQYGTSSITTNMVCAAETAGGQDSCQDDSGGPLITTGTSTLIGVVSFGNGCARRGFAGVYTRVSTQLSFINQYL
ncbi:trypsin-like serine protease [Bimuria novae-zelandiae CBS 107.79]|uniref:Trypsin-like serine protease n=1 Tax=Bimuria novae-zelandiae CBS 107.79 TaxID=1447943 RepID=A0A6A5VPE3_9PLEO|nr:trypsin-like serine protease [Bimuria novae-zelandiae CBS 107.79]